jgi:hypothetical protein
MSPELRRRPLEIAREQVDCALVDGVVGRIRVERLGLGERGQGVAPTLLGDRQGGAVEPALPQARVELQRLVEVLPARLEVAEHALGGRPQQQGQRVPRLLLEHRHQQAQSAVRVAGVERGRGRRHALRGRRDGRRRRRRRLGRGKRHGGEEQQPGGREAEGAGSHRRAQSIAERRAARGSAPRPTRADRGYGTRRYLQ